MSCHFTPAASQPAGIHLENCHQPVEGNRAGMRDKSLRSKIVTDPKETLRFLPSPAAFGGLAPAATCLQNLSPGPKPAPGFKHFVAERHQSNDAKGERGSLPPPERWGGGGWEASEGAAEGRRRPHPARGHFVCPDLSRGKRAQSPQKSLSLLSAYTSAALSKPATCAGPVLL